MTELSPSELQTLIDQRKAELPPLEQEIGGLAVHVELMGKPKVSRPVEDIKAGFSVKEEVK